MRPSTIDWAELDTVCLRYFVRDGVGTRVVFVNEMGGSIEGWHDVIAQLPTDLPLLAYDQRGFGLSEKTGAMSLEAHVDDLRRLLDAVCPDEPVILASAALGAAIAMAYALACPDRVAGLLLASPATGGITPASREAMERRLEAVQRDGLRPVGDAMFAITYPAALPVAPDTLVRHRQRWMAMPERSFEGINRMLGDFDLTPSLGQIACRTLVIGCEHDALRPLARCRELSALLPAGQYREVASGHYLPVQHPALFAELVREFARP